MNESLLILAKRYAKAILDLALQESVIAQADSQLALLAEVTLSDLKARAFWRSLKIPDDEKHHTLQDILEKMDALALVRNTANLLLDTGRLTLLPEIAKAYSVRARRLSQTVHATVTSAGDLSPEMTDRIRDGLARMTGQTVELATAIDPSLLAGVRVRIGNTVIDGSARGRLQALARSFA
jgi:F-type H+-transporting ATPase subunit delta